MVKNTALVENPDSVPSTRLTAVQDYLQLPVIPVPWGPAQLDFTGTWTHVVQINSHKHVHIHISTY